MRRFHEERMKQQAYKKLKTWNMGNYWDENEMRLAACKMANNFQICSCTGCGNPRRHFGALTMQELREFDRMQDFLKEMLDNDNK